MGANNGDFFDGGAQARMNQYGAMQATNHWDGSAAPTVSGADNEYTGHSAAAPQGNGSYN
jgi:hypothetical protein